MWREMRGERKREKERESKKERIAMSLCERAKSLCCSGRLAPSPDAGSLPLLLMIMKLVCERRWLALVASSGRGSVFKFTRVV